jgi:diguanylate cyclase
MQQGSFKEIAGDESERALKSRRLVQMSVFSCVPLAAVLVLTLLDHDWPTALLLLLAVASVLFCLQLNRQGAIDLANAVLIWSLAVTLTFIIWVNEGPYDEAVITYPSLLILAALLLSRGQFMAVLAFLLISLSALYYVALTGLHIYQPHSIRLIRFVDMVCIFVASSAGGWVLAGDLRRTLNRVQVEVRRVKQSEANFAHLAQHDGLTRLPNSALGRQRMDEAIASARSANIHAALMFLDIDDFKTINDSLGHSVGDEFLKLVAQRLSDTIGKAGTLSRQGGDEFLVVLPGISSLDVVPATANQLLRSFAAPFEVRGMQLLASGSIGIALFPDDGDDFESLLQRADMAMYQAKDAGRNTYRFFHQEMNTNVVEHVQLISGLRQALREQEFVLHYQPIVDLASRKLVSTEALLRWQHPTLGLIHPEKFIATAEASGLIVEIGEWVIREACRQLAAWQSSGLSGFGISVNLSTTQLKRGNIDVVVQSALQDSGLDPACLELELTESGLIDDSEKLNKVLASLKALGVTLAIDDFGTGYSNLSYLQRLRVDKLKIDQTFIRRIKNSSQDRAIVAAIIQMANSLHLTTVAEGIEDEDDCLQLTALGCSQGQGYLFARPQSARPFEALVRAQLPAQSSKHARKAL